MGEAALASAAAATAREVAAGPGSSGGSGLATSHQAKFGTPFDGVVDGDRSGGGVLDEDALAAALAAAWAADGVYADDASTDTATVTGWDGLSAASSVRSLDAMDTTAAVAMEKAGKVKEAAAAAAAAAAAEAKAAEEASQAAADSPYDDVVGRTGGGDPSTLHHVDAAREAIAAAADVGNVSAAASARRDEAGHDAARALPPRFASPAGAPGLVLARAAPGRQGGLEVRRRGTAIESFLLLTLEAAPPSTKAPASLTTTSAAASAAPPSRAPPRPSGPSPYGGAKRGPAPNAAVLAPLAAARASNRAGPP
jgi:hypothetical protein